MHSVRGGCVQRGHAQPGLGMQCHALHDRVPGLDVPVIGAHLNMASLVI
jgi:hypothetical protein